MDQAVQLLREAADQGHLGAQREIGHLSGCGHGVAVDRSVALHYFAKAAMQGDETCAFSCGRMYHTGTGTPKNLQEARRYYQLASAQGNAEASELLKQVDAGSGRVFRANGQKAKPNDPCPCGSGKKFKKCCRA